MVLEIPQFNTQQIFCNHHQLNYFMLRHVVRMGEDRAASRALWVAQMAERSSLVVRGTAGATYIVKKDLHELRAVDLTKTARGRLFDHAENHLSYTDI